MVTVKHSTKGSALLSMGPVDCTGRVALKPTLLPTHDQARKKPEEPTLFPLALPSLAGASTDGLGLDSKEARDTSNEGSLLSYG